MKLKRKQIKVIPDIEIDFDNYTPTYSITDPIKLTKLHWKINNQHFTFNHEAEILTYSIQYPEFTIYTRIHFERLTSSEYPSTSLSDSYTRKLNGSKITLPSQSSDQYFEDEKEIEI